MTVTFRQAKLSNGLQVLAECNPDAHTSALGFFVKTGARDEPASLMGVSHFLEHMMFKGTERRSAEDVNRDFDRMGASHNAFTTAEMTAFHAHVLPENTNGALDVLCDIMRPALREKDFDEEKGVILEEIAMYDDNPFWVLWEHANERYFGSHPLGHRVLGTRETVKAMQRDCMLRTSRSSTAPTTPWWPLRAASTLTTLSRSLRSAAATGGPPAPLAPIRCFARTRSA
jgi:predicted Zn-dependent peptidase